MSVLFGLLLCTLLQHHAHDAPLVVTGRGDPILVARTVSRHGPFGHLALLDERLEVTALADVGVALGLAVRRADPPRVAVLVAAGRGEARLHVLDGRTLEETSPPLLLDGVARPSGPLATRGTRRFLGEGQRLLAVLGDPLDGPGESEHPSSPTLWVHLLEVKAGREAPTPSESARLEFPAPAAGPFSLAASEDGRFAAYVGATTVTCLDVDTGAGESFAVPPSPGAGSAEGIDDAWFDRGSPALVLRRGGRADVLDPRTGEWTLRDEDVTSGEAGAEEAAIERRVEPASGRIARFDRRTGEIELVDGPAAPVALPESLKDLEWIAAPRPFPGSWVGTWSGPLEVFAPGRSRPRRLEMSLEVSPTADPGRFGFTITYDDGRAPSRRSYELVEVDAGRGLYHVDEGAGVEIASTLSAETLTQVYSVSSSRIVTQWRRDGESMEFTVVASGEEAENGDGEAPVRSYPVTAVQRATLHRGAGGGR